VLEAAVVQRGPNMSEKHVAHIVSSYETLGLTPGAAARAALEAVVVRVGPDMDPHARAALKAAVVRVAAAEQEDTTIPAAAEEEDTTALGAAEQEVGPSADPQQLADVSVPVSTQ
jgi:hypothetical protein